jgi:hypothetical protein
MTTTFDKNHLFSLYKNVRDLYRSDGVTSKAPLTSKFQEIFVYISKNAPESQKPALRSANTFVRLLLEFPAIWLKLVLTYVFWITMDQIVISPTIKELFQRNDKDENKALESKNFSYNKFEDDIENYKQSAAVVYEQHIEPNANPANSITIDNIKKTLNLIIQLANIVLEHDVGTKARAACEASARGTSLFHYIRLMGCLSGLTPSGPECDQINEALANLITQVQNTDLEAKNELVDY